jgi:hypothetical protein
MMGGEDGLKKCRIPNKGMTVEKGRFCALEGIVRSA